MNGAPSGPAERSEASSRGTGTGDAWSRRSTSPSRTTSANRRTKGVQSNPVLSVAQIKSRYPSEWVLLKNPVVDKDLNVRKGEVAAHDKDRDVVDRQAIAMRLEHSAFLYTGEVPKDAVIIL